MFGPILFLLNLSLAEKGPAYTPFFPRDTSLNMEVLASWTDNWWPHAGGIAVFKNYLYLAYGYEGGVAILALYDSLGKTVVREKGRIDSSQSRAFVFVRGGNLYTGGDSLIKVYSLSDPEHPKLIGKDSLGSEGVGPRKVLFYRNHLYVGEGDIYDVADPYNPKYVGDFGSADEIAIQDTPFCSFPALFGMTKDPSYPYDERVCVISYDLSDPKHPVPRDTLYLSGDTARPLSIVAYRNYLYCFWEGYFSYVSFVDISRPDSMVKLGWDYTNGDFLDAIVRPDAMKLYVCGPGVWYAWFDFTAEVRDVSDPLYVDCLGFLYTDTFRGPCGLDWSGGRIYLIGFSQNDDPELLVLHYTGDTLEPLPEYPWPTLDTLRFEFSIGLRSIGGDFRLWITLPENGWVSVKAYDPSGRLAENVFDGFLNRGYHEIGFDLEGRPRGVYFLRVTYKDEKRLFKIVKGG